MVVMVVRLSLRRRVPAVLVVPVLVVVLLFLLLLLLLELVVVMVVVVQMGPMARGRRAARRWFFLATRRGRRAVVCLRQYRVLELGHHVTGAMLGAHRLEHAAAVMSNGTGPVDTYETNKTVDFNYFFKRA